jgi:hypothetical protein
MRYLLLVHSDEARWEEIDPDTADEATEAHSRLIDELERAGRLVCCSPLQHPDTAREVSVRYGHICIEQVVPVEVAIAGFYLVECDTIDEAVDIAARIPDAATHHVTIRPALTLAGISDA